jgi:hypothetical protein
MSVHRYTVVQDLVKILDDILVCLNNVVMIKQTGGSVL